MTIIGSIWESIQQLIPSGLLILLVGLIIFTMQKMQEARHRRGRQTHFLHQIVLLSTLLVGFLGLILALPIHDATRAQLLGLVGILFSAAIALSSTTLLGNALAGFMLRIVRNFHIGDFIRVGEHFGRVSERGLLHTEIQTEDRDLTTLPNLYLVTHPVTVLRASGTIISATVSIGYDIPHGRVTERLTEAAKEVGLRDPFAQIIELGNFAVTYRVAGLLAETRQILSVRSNLRAAVLDSLHGDGIEIVSPTFMATRALASEIRISPPVQPSLESDSSALVPESIVFDKAEQAASLERLRARLGALEEETASIRSAAKEMAGTEKAKAEHSISLLDERKERLRRLIEWKETKARENDEEPPI